MREAALTYWAKCGWAFGAARDHLEQWREPLAAASKMGPDGFCAWLGEPGTVGIGQAQKRLLELFCCFSQVDGTPALILLEKDSAKSCG